MLKLYVDVDSQCAHVLAQVFTHAIEHNNRLREELPALDGPGLDSITCRATATPDVNYSTVRSPTTFSVGGGQKRCVGATFRSIGHGPQQSLCSSFSQCLEGRWSRLLHEVIICCVGLPDIAAVTGLQNFTSQQESGEGAS